MPNTESAKKRLRQSLERRARNRAASSSMKTAIKRVLVALKAQDVQAAETHFRAAQKVIDQTAAKGVIHRNAGARYKARLSARIKAAKGVKATA
ncbi:MAG: 30S ribosomal protein S20 [Pirellulales bacterium]|nr:30S ribosomal protein S20 [Pirellulales bacterium]